MATWFLQKMRWPKIRTCYPWHTSAKGLRWLVVDTLSLQLTTNLSQQGKTQYSWIFTKHAFHKKTSATEISSLWNLPICLTASFCCSASSQAGCTMLGGWSQMILVFCEWKSKAERRANEDIEKTERKMNMLKLPSQWNERNVSCASTEMVESL